MALIRIDKYLADMCGCTRSEVKQIIRGGRVLADGSIVKSPDLKIDMDTCKVTVDGSAVSYVRYEYYMLNKPQGVVSATNDTRDTTVVELIDERVRKDLFPVGRLDKDTEGLLLITNDGQLTHNLLSPKKHVDKRYYAETNGIITEEMIEMFKNGIDIGDGIITRPALLEKLEMEAKVPLCPNNSLPSGYSRALVTIREGRFHQIKRMFEAFGMNVTYLKRLSMGSLTLDEALDVGDYRRLTEDEISALKEICNLI